MAKYRKINEAISRRSLNWLENYLMNSIEQDYEKIMSGEVSLLSICKDAVEYSKYNHIYFNTREDREQIYQMARECLSRVEDYMAEQKGFADDGDEDEFPSYANESRTVRLSEGQLKQMISESVRKAINEIGDTQRGLEIIKRAKTKANHQGRYMQGDKFREYGEKLDDDTIHSITDDYILYYNLDGKNIRLSKDGSIHVNGKNNGETFTVGMPILKVLNKRAARLIARWITNHTNQTADWHQLAEL